MLMKEMEGEIEEEEEEGMEGMDALFFLSLVQVMKGSERRHTPVANYLGIKRNWHVL